MWLIGRSFVGKYLVGLAVAALLGAMALSSAFGGSAGAHEYSPAFDWDEDETPEVANYNTQYGQQALSARDDYYANTDLDVDWCSYPCGRTSSITRPIWGRDRGLLKRGFTAGPLRASQ